MQSRNALFMVALILGAAACAPQYPAPGTPQAFREACDRANENQLIAVEGYLRLPDSFGSHTTIELMLYAEPAFEGARIGVEMRFGDGPNQVEQILAYYKDDDLKVHLADGHIAPFGMKVRVSGVMHYPVVPEAYACAIENPYIEAAK